MTDLANLFPAIAGSILGIVALVTVHMAMRRLEAGRQARARSVRSN